MLIQPFYKYSLVNLCYARVRMRMQAHMRMLSIICAGIIWFADYPCVIVSW
jgi:hypothetical protein